MRLRNRVRFHLLTGFLGSGKSTLLRRYLHDGSNRNGVAVLINEFGAVAIDHTLVRAVSPHAQTLAGGCACCTVDHRLRASLVEILTQVESGMVGDVTDIVLETSGMADPARVLGTIASDPNLTEYLDIASCVTTVEVGTDATLLDRFPEARSQITCASRLVLTKPDLFSANMARETASLLARVNPLAEIGIASDFDAGAADLFSDIPPRRPRVDSFSSVGHATTLQSFQIELDHSIDWPAFSVWLTALMSRHGDDILRFKGVIPLGQSDHALVLQSVRHRVSEPEHIALDVDERARAFGLVFICDGDYEGRVCDSLARFRALTESLGIHGTA